VHATICACKHVYAKKRTYIHTYMHACIQTNMQKAIHTYKLQTNIQKAIHTKIQTNKHTESYILTCKNIQKANRHNHILSNMHSNMHTYI
jgi:hypothetical protein